MFLGSDLQGKVLGILGAGRIGAGVATRAQRGLGMKVIYYDVAQNKNLEKEISCEYRDTVEAVLKEADVVSIHVPLLPATEHLMNADRLSMMKPTAYLINTSRGPVADEKAILAALRADKLAGAAIDVYDEEPLPLDHPFRTLDNMVTTPHLGYVTAENYKRFYGQMVEDIRAFLHGKPVRVIAAK